VFAVDNDWDKAIARTPVSGQMIVHQRVDTQVGDTYWVQSTTAPSTAIALVDIPQCADHRSVELRRRRNCRNAAVAAMVLRSNPTIKPFHLEIPHVAGV